MGIIVPLPQRVAGGQSPKEKKSQRGLGVSEPGLGGFFTRLSFTTCQELETGLRVSAAWLLNAHKTPRTKTLSCHRLTNRKSGLQETGASGPQVAEPDAAGLQEPRAPPHTRAQVPRAALQPRVLCCCETQVLKPQLDAAALTSPPRQP